MSLRAIRRIARQSQLSRRDCLNRLWHEQGAKSVILAQNLPWAKPNGLQTPPLEISRMPGIIALLNSPLSLRAAAMALASRSLEVRP